MAESTYDDEVNFWDDKFSPPGWKEDPVAFFFSHDFSVLKHLDYYELKEVVDSLLPESYW